VINLDIFGLIAFLEERGIHERHIAPICSQTHAVEYVNEHNQKIVTLTVSNETRVVLIDGKFLDQLELDPRWQDA
jgi:hypothetical protein